MCKPHACIYPTSKNSTLPRSPKKNLFRINPRTHRSSCTRTILAFLASIDLRIVRTSRNMPPAGIFRAGMFRLSAPPVVCRLREFFKTSMREGRVVFPRTLAEERPANLSNLRTSRISAPHSRGSDTKIKYARQTNTVRLRSLLDY
jgi:hypothetical protein